MNYLQSHTWLDDYYADRFNVFPPFDLLDSDSNSINDILQEAIDWYSLSGITLTVI